MRRILPLLLLLFLVVPLTGQERETYAFVIYAEGYDMSIFRNEELLTYDVLRDDVIGMPLLPGDLIQTDSDTFVEIQVMPSRTVIKVAENTTFRIEEIGGSGGGSFDLAYGRLRARVDRVTGNEQFQIRGRNAVAGVRGTDFGYDLVAERQGGAEAETQVYVFEGSVEVTESADGGGGDLPTAGGEDSPGGVGEDAAADQGTPEGAPSPAAGGEPRTIVLTANQMVSVIRRTVAEALAQTEEGEETEPAPARQVVTFEEGSIEEEIQEFWRNQDFQEEPVNPEQVEDRFPDIKKKVSQLATERREFLLAQKRGALQPEEPAPREPEDLRLGVPPADERLRRSITPQQRTEWGRSAERGGAVLTATGTVVGLAALGLAFGGDQVISGYEPGLDNPVTSAALLSGGVFFSTGMLSLIASFFSN